MLYKGKSFGRGTVKEMDKTDNPYVRQFINGISQGPIKVRGLKWQKGGSEFVCQGCGAVYPKWQGKCDACGEWNTIMEEKVGGEGFLT